VRIAFLEVISKKYLQLKTSKRGGKNKRNRLFLSYITLRQTSSDEAYGTVDCYISQKEIIELVHFRNSHASQLFRLPKMVQYSSDNVLLV